MNEIPCKCGHLKSEHENNPLNTECLSHKEDEFNFDDACMEYIPDNLTYIEQEAKRRNLV